MYGYEPNEHIVNRAVELWIRMLSNPKYDNMGTTVDTGETPEQKRERLRIDDPRETSGISSLMAKSLPNNATPQILQRFGMELKKRLMVPEKHEEKRRDIQEREGVNEYVETWESFTDTLSVDYGPDGILSECAEAAGLKMEFPWKTVMWLYEDHVSLRNGYGALTEYHYPVSGERNLWIVTTLSGSKEDVRKLIDLMRIDRPDEMPFVVERGRDWQGALEFSLKQ